MDLQVSSVEPRKTSPISHSAKSVGGKSGKSLLTAGFVGKRTFGCIEIDLLNIRRALSYVIFGKETTPGTFWMHRSEFRSIFSGLEPGLAQCAGTLLKRVLFLVLGDRRSEGKSVDSLQGDEEE